jgi:hypothetical protein
MRLIFVYIVIFSLLVAIFSTLNGNVVVDLGLSVFIVIVIHAIVITVISRDKKNKRREAAAIEEKRRKEAAEIEEKRRKEAAEFREKSMKEAAEKEGVNHLFLENFASCLPRLMNDEELVKMADNYITKFPPNYFVDPEFITNVETCIFNSYVIGDALLLSTKELREKSSISFEAIQYVDQNLVLFAKYINEHLEIKDSILSLYLAYLFIYKNCIKHFSKIWTDEFIDHFADINDITTDEAISRYCEIENIDPSNFITSGTFIYFLIDKNKYRKFNDNYLLCYDEFTTKLASALENKKYNDLIGRLKAAPAQKVVSLDDIDMMDGVEFEKFIAALFSNMGYQTEITKGSGDQGIDVIATKNGKKIGVQAKRYSGTVGNGAIQEAVAGIKYYQLDKAVVVTNNFFSFSAQQLASANSIILWDRNILKEKL